MQQHHHTSLAPISEQQPRRSLRYPPAIAELDRQQQQPRRYTLMPPATTSGIRSDSSQTGTAADIAKQRRASRRRTSSIRSSERGSQGRPSGVGLPGVQQLENTYRMGPAQPFKTEAAELLIKERLESNLKRYSYNAQSAKVMSTNLAQEIKNKIKQQLMQQGPNSRYKLVVLVTVTEAAAPSGEFATRMLCQATTGDACAKAEFRGTKAAGWAAVFALYYE